MAKNGDTWVTMMVPPDQEYIIENLTNSSNTIHNNTFANNTFASNTISTWPASKTISTWPAPKCVLCGEPVEDMVGELSRTWSGVVCGGCRAIFEYARKMMLADMVKELTEDG